MGRRIRKWIKRIALVPIALVLLECAWLGYRFNFSQPGLDGAIKHPSLKDEVTVTRDQWGVPHIVARQETDAYFALGYCQAQDRLFQLDAMRRLAAGRLAEIAGPIAAPVDAIVKGFRLRRTAEEQWAKISTQYPEIGAIGEAYVAGINHRIATDPTPPEYSFLALSPEPFDTADCLTVAAILPITFADGIREDPLNTMLQARIKDKDVQLLFPGYHREVPVTVMETLEEAESFIRENQLPAYHLPAPANANADQLLSLLKPLKDLNTLFGPALGSNSWVLGPSRTKSGKALLANDPHIGFTNPSIWYEAHLKYGDFENYGYHLPLVPFPLLGHNRNHAWALTMFANDDVDLYQETFNPDDPNQVKYKGEWVPVRVEETPIKVRFGRDTIAKVRITNHGPVITDLLKALMGYEGPDVSLSWVWQHLDYTDMAGFYKMGHAKTYEEFEAGTKLITSPGVNISYVDSANNFAWWAAGRLPIRPQGMNNKALLDGASGAHEILGYVPAELNPHLKNPDWGYIVTANNKSSVKAFGGIQDLQGYWQPTDRAGRIEHLLETAPKWDSESLKTVQFDDTAHATGKLLPVLFAALDKAGFDADSREAHALAILKQWDHAHGKESAGAAIYQQFFDRIFVHALGDEMGEDNLFIYTSLADSWNFMKYFMIDEANPFWDDSTTEAAEPRDTILAAAFRDTVDSLTRKMGDDMGAWQWGKIHTMEFTHPLGYLPFFDKLFNIGPFPASGGAQIVNNMLYRGLDDFETVAGPSTRRLIDFGAIENTLSILPTGNSGHPKSPHYDDQSAMFLNGEYRTVNFTEEQIAANARHTLKFSPGK